MRKSTSDPSSPCFATSVRRRGKQHLTFRVVRLHQFVAYRVYGMRTPELRFSATLGEAPEVKVALV